MILDAEARQYFRAILEAMLGDNDRAEMPFDIKTDREGPVVSIGFQSYPHEGGSVYAGCLLFLSESREVVVAAMQPYARRLE